MERHRECYTADEMRELLGVSRGSIYESVRSGTLPHVRLGNRILFPKGRIHRWLEGDA